MFTVREALIDDFQGIQLLKKRHNMESKSYQEWQHIWQKNPVTASSKNLYPIGWVMEDSNKQIVGYLGSIPMEYEFGGKQLIIASATSFIVDPKYRNYSIFLFRNFLSQKHSDLQLMTTANYKAGKVYSAFKAKKVPVVSYDTALFWVINYQKFAHSAFIKKQLPFGRIFKYPLSMILQGRDKLSEGSRVVKKPSKEIQYYSDFDERFDIFWNKLKNKYPNRLMRVRNKKQLSWNFKNAIANKKVWIFALEEKSQILSYAIFLRQDNSQIGLKRVRLVDIQSIKDDADVFMEMIMAGTSKCRSEGIDVLEVIGFNFKKRKIMEQYAPHKRKLPNWPFYYKAKSNMLDETLSNSEAWDPCFLDGDASL